MAGMFCGCSSLEELNLNNFNTINVNLMNRMFEGCSSLKKLEINFNIDNQVIMKDMFKGCSNELKEIIKNQYDSIKYEALF